MALTNSRPLCFPCRRVMPDSLALACMKYVPLLSPDPLVPRFLEPVSASCLIASLGLTVTSSVVHVLPWSVLRNILSVPSHILTDMIWPVFSSIIMLLSEWVMDTSMISDQLLPPSRELAPNICVFSLRRSSQVQKIKPSVPIAIPCNPSRATLG